MNSGESSVLVILSKGGLFPHTHKLNIPKENITYPPKEGIRLQTSEEYSLVFKHSHWVKIGFEQLTSISRGEEIIVHDVDKGRHSFAIRVK